MRTPALNKVNIMGFTPKVYLMAYLLLLCLLGTTFAAYFVSRGIVGIVVALSIAVAKTVIILRCFMGVSLRGPVIIVFASSISFWLLILFALTVADLLTRT